jgi:uncharacterized membrane protein
MAWGQWQDTDVELSDREKSLLNRIARQKNLYLMFSILSVVIAVTLLIYYGLIAKNITSLRFVIVVLILLAGRSHLRQYRSAVILHKVKLWLDNSGDENKINIR